MILAKKGVYMSETELLEMFIQERINMLLLSLDKKQSKEGGEGERKIFKGEEIINRLPDEDKKLIQEYIDNIIDRMAREEPFLYQCGFWDGIKVLKKIMNL